MTESKLQKAVTKTLNQVLQQKVFWTSVEVSNGRGGKSAMINQAALKSRGIKTGFPDVFILWTEKEALKALFIELKWKYNGLHAAQIKCHEELASKLNAPVVICRSVDDVLEALDIYDVPTTISKS